MKRTLLLAIFLVTLAPLYGAELDFPSVLANHTLPFVSHTGPGAFDNALALNVEFEPVAALKKQLEKSLGKQLHSFKGWNPQGEAHVTVITPPEFANTLSKFLSMTEIEQIAREQKIQESDLTLFGLGMGKKQISGRDEETYFVIVDSNRLRAIRTKVWQAYVHKGGAPQDWDPTWFFPHITVAFTKQDLHEPDVLKNIKHSFDRRFQLKFRP